MSQSSHDKEKELLQLLKEKEAVITKLQSENDFLHEVLSLLPGNMYWKDRSGKYLGCNHNQLKFLGLSRLEQIIGKTDYDLYHKEIADQIRTVDEEVMLLSVEKECEEAGVDTLGNKVVYLTRKIPLTDHNNHVEGLLGISLDITHRKKAEGALRAALDRVEVLNKANENQFYEILNAVPASIYWKDKEGRYLGCNQYLLKLAGLKHLKDIIGKQDHQLIWHKEADQLFKTDQQVIHSKTALEIEETSFLANRHIIFLTTKTPLFSDQGTVIGLIGVSIDITERKKAEEALRIALDQSELANRSKSEFIQNMSHDIRNPLASILGMAQILYDTTTDETQTYARMLMQSSERLLDLLNNVLDLASAAQENQIKQEPVALKKIAQDLKELLTPSLHTKQLVLNLEIDSNVPTVLGDANKIERILLNLLNNAIKFTDQGSITLKIETLKIKQDRVQFAMHVIDTGIGIPEDKLHRVFEEFFRVHPSYEGIYPGHGVGLYIVKKYTELMHGEVKVQSQLGVGTTFTITLELPITEQILEPDEETQTQTHIQAHILLIEDEELAYRAAKSILEKAGHTITSARNLKEACQQIKTHRFEVIITDLGLPDGSGMDLARAYRKQEKSGHTPIFALTGHGSEVKEQCYASGIDSVFTKGTLTGLLKQIQLSLSNPTDESEIGSYTNDPGMHHTEQYFDTQQASELLGEEIRSLIQFWLIETLPEERVSLLTAYQQKDWNKLQHHAHKLKGSSAYVGAQKLYQACKALEDHLMSGSDQNRDALFQTLIACIDKTKFVIEAWFEAP